MKGSTDKDAIFSPKKHKICILEIKIGYHIKILVVLHYLQRNEHFQIKDEHVIFVYFYELPKCLFPLPDP